MLRSLSFCVCTVLLTAAWVNARTEYHLGGVEGPSWQDARSQAEVGAYRVYDANGNLLRSVAVGTVPQETGGDTLVDFSDFSIRPRFIDPHENLALTDLSAESNEVPLNFTGGEVSVSYGNGTSAYNCLFAGNNAPLNKLMLDANPVSAQFRPFTQDPNKAPGIGKGRPFYDAIIFDFGANVPINRIRFYPRLSQEEDRLLIESFAEPKPALESFGADSFADNFVGWFDIRVGDASLPFQDGACGRTPGRRWITRNDPLLTELYSTRENLDVVTDLSFTARSIRFLTFQAFPLRNWEIAELEIYGEGFVEEMIYITQILDFGRPVSYGQIRWSGELPEGTWAEIRTRTGHTPDPKLYFVLNNNGDLDPITLKEYLKIDALSRLPTQYDTENWSFWSPPYDFAAGLRDEALPAEAWQDGTPLLSPGPSRYIQIAIRFFSAPFAAPRLDQLSLQLGEVPSAQEVVGEIWPIEVDSFEPATFTYVVLPSFGADNIGFDHLEILTHARVDTIEAVVLDGTRVDPSLFPNEIFDDRIVVEFPAVKGEEDSFKQLEVVFNAPVLRYGTEFSSWVFSSEDPDQIRQQVRPGNATFRFSGDVLAVKTPVGGNLLVNVEVGPNPFTPNGDGINETLTIAYSLREVATDRTVSVRIYNLAGQEVAALPPTRSRSGQFRQEWDGTDANGQRVPPGIYLYDLSLNVEQTERTMGFLAVAY